MANAKRDALWAPAIDSLSQFFNRIFYLVFLKFKLLRAFKSHEFVIFEICKE